MTKREFVVTRLEGCLKLEGSTLEKPVYPVSNWRALQRIAREISKSTRDSSYTVTVQVASRQ